MRYLVGVTTQSIARHVIRPLQPRTPLQDVIQISRVTVSHPRVSPAFHGYRILLLTDLHLGTWIDEDRLTQLVPLVNACRPDLIALAGDLISYLASGIIDRLVPVFRAMQAPDGLFAVRGNHDCWAGERRFRTAMEQSGVRLLTNAAVPLDRCGETLYVCGLDTAYYAMDRLDDILEQLPESALAMLLAHEPDTAVQTSRTGRFALQLSGHSHGGQIHLPGIGSPWLPRLGRKYPSGHYKLNGMHLYTSRGVGTSSLPLRINCPAEIPLLTLSAAA